MKNLAIEEKILQNDQNVFNQKMVMNLYYQNIMIWNKKDHFKIWNNYLIKN